MRGWLVLIMAVIFFVGFAAEQNEHEHEVWAHIESQAEEVIELVEAQNYEEARSRLRDVSDELTSTNYEAMDLDVHDMGTIIMSYERLDGALTQATLAHDERLREALRFHYVVDAVVHTDQPKWKETENEVKEQLKALREEAAEGGTSFQHAWNDWMRTFEKIHPAATLRLSLSEREEIRSLVAFMSEHSHRLKDPDEGEPFFNALQEAIDRLYNEEASQDDPSLIVVMITVSGAIVLSLSYAGWKKYKGEKKRARGRRER